MKHNYLLKLADHFFLKISRLEVDSLQEDFKKYITNEKNPQYFISYSDHIKLGLNPNSHWGNPKGIYGSPFTSAEYTSLAVQNDWLAFSSKPYIWIFKVLNVFNMNDYSNDDYLKHFEQLKLLYKDIDFSDEFLNSALEKFYERRPWASKRLPIVKLLAITTALSTSDANWSTILRHLGFTNLYCSDSSQGFKYPQVVVLDPSAIKIVDMKTNPLVNSYSREMSKSEQNLISQKINNKKNEINNLLKDTNLSSERLSAIFRTNLSEHQLRLFLKCKNVPAEILYALSKHPSLEIREAVARHSNAEAETLESLIIDPKLFYIVALNKNTTKEILAEIYNAGDNITKSSVISNENAPHSLLIKYLIEEELTVDEDFFGLESCSRLDESILNKIINGDYSPLIKERANFALKCK